MRWLLLMFLAAACHQEARPDARVEASGPPLPFIEDDYPKALGEARASKRPIFVEAWAPW
jgi:hypothetical protein